MKNLVFSLIGFALPLVISAQAAIPAQTTFTGRFTTKKYYYELNQSFEYPGDSIAPSKVEKRMECVSQSGDGCDQEGCVARLYFDLGEKRLAIRSLASDQTIVDLRSPATMLVQLPQDDCRDLRVAIPASSSVLAQISDRVPDFQLEGHLIGGWMLFSGHGTLNQDPDSGAFHLRGFHFDDGQSQALYIEDYVCLNGPSIFEENCRARFLSGLRQDPPSE